ncbi:MAG: hypothetical protein B6D55_05575 [Candidatus Omnitrophica bacterium 4484_70.2]|nr:MAG: hypothetical protein B6D55_05575 [Candidatus Omnitrophica bacterium 4484_70.2]
MLWLIGLFIILPLLELYLLIKIGYFIGAFNTVMIVILTGIIGAILVKMEGLKIIYNIQTQINRGIMPAQEFLEGFLILVAGFLLITPGFLTDIVGFLLVFKSTRRFILIFIKRKIQDFINRGRTITIFYKEL